MDEINFSDDKMLVGRTFSSRDLILNLVSAFRRYERQIQERIIGHLTKCDEDFVRRVAEGLGINVEQHIAQPAPAA